MTAATRTATQAARTVPATGVEHAIRFLDGLAGELFVSVHSPAGGAHVNLVMCPPLLADHAFNYRRELLLGVELARRGVAFWRFHYAGTGHSEGSPEAGSFEACVADARFVIDEATKSSTAPVVVGGTRCGAMVAAAVAGNRPLVLWEPVDDGSAYLAEGFRARMIADRGQLRRIPPKRAELVSELRRAGRIDLVGFSLHERLHDSIEGLQLRDLVGRRSTRVLLIASPSAEGSEPAIHQELREMVPELTTATVGVPEAWWFHRTQQADHAALAADVAGVIGPWVPRSSTPATVTPPPGGRRRVGEFVEAGDSSVFALLTPPTGAPRGEAALLLWGGGGIPAFGRNQVAATLARRLAQRGYHVLQMDYPGRGDSPGSEPPDPIDEAGKLKVFEAVRAAYAWLRSRGLSRVLTIGSCQGAVAALSTADAAPTLTGLALLAPNIAERGEVSDDGKVHPMHPRMRSSFNAVGRAGTPLLLVYGVHDEGFPTFKAAMDVELGLLLHSAGSPATVSLTEERIQGYMTVSGQEESIDLVMRWVEGLGS